MLIELSDFCLILSDPTHTVAEQCSNSKEEIYGITFWSNDPTNHAWQPHWLCHTGISSLIIAYRMASRVGDESNFWIYDLSYHAWDPRDYVTLWFPSSGTLVTQTCLRVLWPLASAGKGMYRVIFFQPKKFCWQKPSVHFKWHISLKTNIFDRPQVSL